MRTVAVGWKSTIHDVLVVHLGREFKSKSKRDGKVVQLALGVILRAEIEKSALDVFECFGLLL